MGMIAVNNNMITANKDIVMANDDKYDSDQNVMT